VLSSPSRNISASLPLELVAIVFTRGTLSQDDSTLMEVLGQSLDRQSIKDVLLRGQGEVAGAILPQWAGGYEFLFPVTVDLRRARQLRGQLGRAGTWSLGYDASDPANQLLAERIALNAKDGGITLQPAATQNADLRLIRVYVASSNPAVALTEMSRSLGLLSPKFADGSIHAVYQAELADVETRRVLPIIFIPASYLTSPALQNWRIHPDGTWDASNLWLKQGTP
jgi:hypothetical protein